jgi:IS5 family transposase
MQERFSDPEYAAKENLTRRDGFPAEIDNVPPWVEPFYPKVVCAGRPPIRLTRTLRMHVAQQCCGLSNRAGTAHIRCECTQSTRCPLLPGAPRAES